jgi:hypothetical protein
MPAYRHQCELTPEVVPSVLVALASKLMIITRDGPLAPAGT